jgi:hypothetical protein
VISNVTLNEKFPTLSGNGSANGTGYASSGNSIIGELVVFYASVDVQISTDGGSLSGSGIGTGYAQSYQNFMIRNLTILNNMIKAISSSSGYYYVVIGIRLSLSSI